MSQGSLDHQPPGKLGRQANVVPLFIGVFPLGCWPFLIVPNLMSFAGEEGSGAPAGPVAAAAFRCFLWGSTLYPLVFLAAVAVTFALAFVAERPAAASGAAWFPLAYALGLLGCFLAAWLAT